MVALAPFPRQRDESSRTELPVLGMHLKVQPALPALRQRRGALGDEPDAHTLGTDEADYLLNLVRKLKSK